MPPASGSPVPSQGRGASLSEVKAYQIVIRSNKTWTLSYAQKAANEEFFRNYTQVAGGMIAASLLRTAATDRNDIVLRLTGPTGVLLINGTKVADLDLGTNTDMGEVSNGIQYSRALGKAGAVTRYEDFTITNS